VREDRFVPLVEELVPPPDPVQCCERLSALPYRVFLDSAARGPRLGRYSFLTADPVAIVRSKGTNTECDGGHPVTGDALDTLRALLAPFAADPVPGLPPFQGGAAGYLAYDWGRVLERLPAPRHEDLDVPDVVLGVYDWVLAWDHEASRAWLISTGLLERSPSLTAAGRRAAAARARAAECGRAGTVAPEPDTPSRRVRAGAGARPAPTFPVGADASDPRLELRSTFTYEGYLDAVARVREYIFAGDIFQANLSQRFDAPLIEPPWSLYRRLRTRNAAPFAAYLDFPEALVLSASPERFLSVTVGRQVETRPIKGTRPRGLGPEHDAALGMALTASAKDRAENLMIVDLLRNDLSRVCSPGSVRVPELFALEHYATVHHLVSTVVGDLAPGEDALGLLRAAFPGGSITGAPKCGPWKSSRSSSRPTADVAAEVAGTFLAGALDCSIAIRTAVAHAGRVYFNAGGGIVADSEPEQEYRETLDKARGMIDALRMPE
jgi:para-aminobenzoate synthetase component 1